MRNYGIRQTQSGGRIVMICPNCGQENSEAAEELRGMRFYACAGDGCDYTFDLTGTSKRVGNGFVEACKRFYAALYATRGQAAR
jgi:transposase-like protein